MTLSLSWPHPTSNRGVVLIFALSVMVIIATISLSIQRTTQLMQETIQEDQLRHLSFQAADAGISYAEGVVRTLFKGSSGTGFAASPPDIYGSLDSLAASDGWVVSGNEISPAIELSQVFRDPDNPTASEDNPERYRTDFIVKLNKLDAASGDPVTPTTGMAWKDLVNNFGVANCADTAPPNLPLPSDPVQTGACEFSSSDQVWYRIVAEGRAYPTDATDANRNAMATAVAVTRIVSYYSIQGDPGGNPQGPYKLTFEGWEIDPDVTM